MKKHVSVALSTLLGAGLVVGLTPGEAHAAGSIRDQALKTAADQKGKPYRDHAAGPNAYDCSGLTQYAYKRHGKSLPHNAQAQFNSMPHVSPSNRKVGDLVFIGRSSGSTTPVITHVGIYTGWKHGKGWMLNANSGDYRGHKVVEAPIEEYVKGSPRAFYGRPTSK